MKTLTIRQPYAQLISAGAKRIETRTRRTKHRGKVLIHAAALGGGKRQQMLTRDLLISPPFWQVLGGMYDWQMPDLGELERGLPFGAIIAETEILGCEEITPKNTPNKPEFHFGLYRYGHWMWHLGKVRRIKPVPAKGKLSFWEYEGEVDYEEA